MFHGPRAWLSRGSQCFRLPTPLLPAMPIIRVVRAHANTQGVAMFSFASSPVACPSCFLSSTVF